MEPARASADQAGDVATPDRLPEAQAQSRGSVLEVLAASTRLGLTSFGGPVAHLGYFRDEYVVRRKWIDEQSYADLVALCQFLPGPASSQVGIAIGIIRAGVLGGIVSWLGFTMPSAIAMILFGLSVQSFDVSNAGWLHGLKIVAVAVVAQAVWGMARSLCPDRERATIAILAAIAMLLWPLPLALGQVLIIVVAGLVGWRLLPTSTIPPGHGVRVSLSRRLAIVAWILFFGLLFALPLLRQVVPSQALAVFDSFYRVGSLVFGGGHVVLPLLYAEVVPTGWVTSDQFVAGYGAAQAVPGPLFTFAAYLGTVMQQPPNGVVGGLFALFAIYLPTFFMTAGALPFWDTLRARPSFQSGLRGINAAVVGVLTAALYTPIWTSAIMGPADFALGLAAFGLLVVWKLPPWLVVLFGALGGQALAMLPLSAGQAM